ncbi:MAG TPA: M48 family metalloprotease [Gaiellaceae bacterium]|nr:M48 family metalloprotease [Gaiellaceae bacterium]
MAAAGLWLAAAFLLWRTSVPAGVELPELDAREVFGADHVERSARYERGLRLLWLGAVAAQLTVLTLAAWLAPRWGGRGIAAGVALAAATLVAVWLARLPFVLGAHWWRRRYGISQADYGTILLDPWLERIGTLLATCAAVAALMLLARGLGDRWWIVGGAAFAAIAAAFLLAQPYLLVPRLQPLRDAALAAEIRMLAHEQGVGEVDVEVRDASRRTRAINAEIYGVGPTKRIILWDTALDGRLGRGEVRSLAAHEFGHVEADHIWKSIGWLFLFAVPGAYVIERVTRPRGGLGRAPAVPLALLAFTVLQLALLPATNAISRRYEAEADWLALRATADPRAFEGLTRKLARASLAQPDPPGWARVVFETHPSPLERIAMSRAAALPEGS